MRWLALILRSLSKLRFKLLGLATIKNIPTDRFKQLVSELTAAGWIKSNAYDGFDAWVDYGNIRLRKAGCTLNLEWDNWTEGSIEGPKKVIEALANEKGFRVTHEWRWAEYDNNV